MLLGLPIYTRISACVQLHEAPLNIEMSDFLGIRSLKFSTVQTAAQFIFVYEISSWKRDDVFEWICRLDMPIPGLWVEIAEQLWDEHVDGESFLSTTYKDWFDFDVLCHVSIGLLIACRDVYRQLLIAGPVTDVFTGATKPSGPMQQPFPQPAGELSELHDMDIHCTDMAGLQEAFVYGQLIVLGNQVLIHPSIHVSLLQIYLCFYFELTLLYLSEVEPKLDWSISGHGAEVPFQIA